MIIGQILTKGKKGTPMKLNINKTEINTNLEQEHSYAKRRFKERVTGDR
jgi:hypothetical protein